ncbi:MAG: ABC transporter permease [Acidobacteriota bacterium]|nr:ABC transporter permease [Acidobacteriota bacterium]
MIWLRRGSFAILLALFALSLGANWVAPASSERQSRAEPDSPPAKSFPLGTDNLGRDRLSRLLYGMRFSLLLAPVAAALAMMAALLVGGSAALAGGWWDRVAMSATDLFLSLPWLFLFLTVRAKLPLNTEPITSLLITFALMGLLGWAAGARVVRATVLNLRHSPFALYARAFGCAPARLWLRHLLPHLGTVLLAQFWVAIPGFILGEASLGLLGMGAPPPLPTWGNLLRELETAPGWNQYWVFAPVLLLSLVMVLFQLSRPAPEGVRSA